DVVVVRDFDRVKVGSAKLRHLRDQEVRESFPPRTSCVGRTTLALEHVPFQRLIGRNHERRIDFGKRKKGASRGDRRACTCVLSKQRLASQNSAGGDSCSGLKEGSPRGWD